MRRRMMGRLGTGSATGLLALLAALTQASPLVAQERPGRQAQLSVDEMAELREAVRSQGGRVIVGFKPAAAERGVSPTGRPLLAAPEVRALAEDLRDAGLERSLRSFDLIPAVVAVVDPAGLEALLADPRVDYVEPDRLVDPMETAAPGALPGAEMAQEVPWGIQRVGAPEAWGTTRGEGVAIGIIDSGIDADHADLTVAGGINLVTGGTTSADWDDASPFCGSHGTHVAGTAAALDNDVGVVGVAPAADLYALRVFDPEADGIEGCQAYTSSIIAALEWAVGQGLDVVNMSLGSFFSSFAKLDAARATAAGGVAMVASAGNGGPFGGVVYPAGYPEVVAVAASDEFDDLAFFSSIGPEVELTAPGVEIVSTTNDGGTGSKHGTSMASPHVAGAVALLREAASGLTPERIRSLLGSTATDLGVVGVDREFGHGLIDLATAVGAATGGQPLLATSERVVHFWSPPGSNPASTTVALQAIGASGSVGWSASTEASWLQVSPASGNLAAGGTETLTITADPSALTELVHPAVVTISGDGANPSLEVPVRFAVASRIAQDAAQSWTGTIPTPDARQRFVLSGTAGDRIDIAVLNDPAGIQFDRVVWLYMPDGRTVLARADQHSAPEAMLGPFQPLLYDVELPVTGDYFVEVGANPSHYAYGDFLVKARPAGPILGVSRQELTTGEAWMRAEEAGATSSAAFLVGNISSVGTLSWSASTDVSWLTLSPASGSGAPSLDVREVQGLAVPEMEGAADRTSSGPEDAPQLQITGGTTVTLTADPAGLTLGDHFGNLVLASADGWLPQNSVAMGLRVYSAGVTYLQTDSLFYVTGGDVTVDVPGRALVLDWISKDISPVTPDGVVGAPFVTNARGDQPRGFVQGPDGDWYLARNATVFSGENISLSRVTREGEKSIFAEIPGNSAIDVTSGPDGKLYVSDPYADGSTGGIWRVDLDGTVETDLAYELTSGLSRWIAYNPVDDALYVASWGADLHRYSLSDGSILAMTPPPVEGLRYEDITIGRSGRIYANTAGGTIWVWEAGSTAAPTEVARTPGVGGGGGIALLEGYLVATGFPFGSVDATSLGEGYLVPVQDGPALYGDVAAGFDFDAADALRGEPITIPVALETLMSGDGTAAFDLSLQWSTADLDFQGYAAGTFGGTTVTDNSASGALQVSGSQADAAWGEVPVVSVTFATDAAAAPGDTLGVVDFQIGSLTGTSGADLTPFLTTGPGAICVDTHGLGDVSRDGTLGSADAVQALIAVVGGTLAQGADPDLADVNRDGEITVTDPVLILRQLVELPVPETSRIGAYGVGGCR